MAKRAAQLLYGPVLVFVPSDPQVHTETHQPDQTKININGFDMAKSAAQHLYGPVLVSIRSTGICSIPFSAK